MRTITGMGSESRRGLTPTLAAAVAAILLLGGCSNMSAGGKGATAGAAVGTGIGLATGGGFTRTIGGGLIGAGVGYIGGEALGND
jgi:hypothetical protein